MSAERDDELRAALALLRSEPPDNGFEQRLSARLAYEVSLRPLRAEPPARDFEQRLHERLLAEPRAPVLPLHLVRGPGALDIVGGAEPVIASAPSNLLGLTPGTPDQVAVAPPPSATPKLAAAAPSPAAAPRKRTRGAWLAAAIVLLAGGATASAQSGLFVGLAARVEHVVSTWSRSSATAERERAAVVAPERQERLVAKPTELPRRELREEPRPEPAVVAPPAPAAAPVERLELSAEQRARASEASARRTRIERVQRDVGQATRERQSRAARTTLPRAAALSADRRDEGPRRAQIERVRIEPGAIPARRPSVERVRPGDVVREITRERQSRERPEIIRVQDSARRGPAPEPPRRERSPQDLTRGERPRR